jgi:hypothetical protein
MASVIMAFQAGVMQTFSGGKLTSKCLLDALKEDEFTGLYSNRDVSARTIVRASYDAAS